MYQMERTINEILWHDTFRDFGHMINEFENETFQIKPYCWSDKWDNSWHFWHKPSGLKVQWYKYPLRSPRCNMIISHEKFLDVLRDCKNSLNHKDSITKIILSVDRWWEGNEHTESRMTNFDEIKAMSIEEMATFLTSLLDGKNQHDVGCYDCIFYGTHHADIDNKDLGIYECEGCSNEGVGYDLKKWLNKEINNGQ